MPTLRIAPHMAILGWGFVRLTWRGRSFFKTYMERSIRPRKPLDCGIAGRELVRPAWASAVLVTKVLASLVSARLEMVSACC